MSKAIEEDVRICRKVLRMVSELHIRGFFWLRIVPFIYETGSWRCGVTPVSNILASHGAIAHSYDPSIVAQHSNANGRDFFGWTDSRKATPSRLAEIFIERFPRIVAEGYGSDWMYAGWYQEMLHLTFPGSVPIAHDNYNPTPTKYMETRGYGPSLRLPLPPPGWVRLPAE